MTIAMSDAAADDAAFLKAVSEALRSNVEIKDRRVRLRTQQLCFVGAEAVTFLVTAGHAPTREAAVALGQRLLCNQFLRKLSNSDGEFLDSNLLYRFAEDEAAPIRKASPALGGPFRPTRRSSKFSHATTSSSIEGSSSGSKPRFHSSYRSAGSYDHSTYCHEDEVAQGIRTQSLIDEQRAARLRKSSFCPIESILTVAPVSTVGFTDTCSFYFSPHTTHNSIALTVPIVTAMKAAFSSRNLHARETAVHHLRNQVLKAADPSDKSWMYLKNITGHHGNDVRVFCKTSGGGFQTVLTVGPVHVAPSTFVTHFLDSNERKKMDALFETSQTVEDLLMAHRRDKMHVKNHFHEVFSTAAAAPWMDPEHPMPDEVHWAVQPSERMADMFPEQQQQPHAPHHDMSGLKTDGGVQRILYRTMAPPSAVLSARDFVTFQDCFSMDNGAHCVYEISVEHRDIPSKMERYTRGEVLCLAHIAEPIPGNPNASMLTVVTQVGLKGKLPAFIANLIFEKLISRSFDAQVGSRGRDGVVPDDIVQRISSGGAMPANKDGNKVGLQDFELLAVLGRGYDILVQVAVVLTFVQRDTKRLFMVMDFVQGGDLFAHLRKYGAVPVPRARLYLAEIALAVSHLHALDIVYRDLKPENVCGNNNS
ncbi:hypothetical protein DYB32_000605 [Aphanomyces invadans]|uniref:Protein kinase domain-containing protein n=1 Tax=Aphanomyces invadans TaxID=157072 RepID=A0A3R6WTL0_9STRA|nr:hypothetical protein DYB32_000605 [Aphanomyces invadans]